MTLVEYDDTDASGETRLVGSAATARSTARPALTLISAFTTSASLRRHIWRAHQLCVECGKKIESPDVARVLEVPDDGAALACQDGPCFALAVARFNPTFDATAALERELALEETLERDLRLIPDIGLPATPPS